MSFLFIPIGQAWQDPLSAILALEHYSRYCLPIYFAHCMLIVLACRFKDNRTRIHRHSGNHAIKWVGRCVVLSAEDECARARWVKVMGAS